MADVPTPPTPPGPGKLASGAKGKLAKMPKWAWIAGAVVLIGVAWMTYKNSTNAEAPVDEFTDPNADIASQVFPGPTQGAYAGGDVPPLDGGGTVDGGDGLGTVLSLLDYFDKRDAAMQPSPLSFEDSFIPATPVEAGTAVAAAATGGGPAGRTVTNHLGVPSPVVKNGKFYHVYNKGKKNEKWVYVRPASKTAPAAKKPAAARKPAAAPAHRPAAPKPAPKPAPHQPVSTAPRNVVKNGKFYHVYNYGTASERWVYVRKAS